MTTHLRLAGDPQAPDLTQLLGHVSTALRGIADALDCIQRLADAQSVAEPVVDESPLKARDAAEFLRLPYKQLLALVHSGEIGHVRPGREYLIPRAEIRRYLATADRRAS